MQREERRDLPKVKTESKDDGSTRGCAGHMGQGDGKVAELLHARRVHKLGRVLAIVDIEGRGQGLGVLVGDILFADAFIHRDRLAGTNKDRESITDTVLSILHVLLLHGVAGLVGAGRVHTIPTTGHTGLNRLMGQSMVDSSTDNGQIWTRGVTDQRHPVLKLLLDSLVEIGRRSKASDQEDGGALLRLEQLSVNQSQNLVHHWVENHLAHLLSRNRQQSILQSKIQIHHVGHCRWHRDERVLISIELRLVHEHKLLHDLRPSLGLQIIPLQLLANQHGEVLVQEARSAGCTGSTRYLCQRTRATAVVHLEHNQIDRSA